MFTQHHTVHFTIHPLDNTKGLNLIISVAEGLGFCDFWRVKQESEVGRVSIVVSNLAFPDVKKTHGQERKHHFTTEDPHPKNIIRARQCREEPFGIPLLTKLRMNSSTWINVHPSGSLSGIQLSELTIVITNSKYKIKLHHGCTHTMYL